MKIGNNTVNMNSGYYNNSNNSNPNNEEKNPFTPPDGGRSSLSLMKNMLLAYLLFEAVMPVNPPEKYQKIREEYLKEIQTEPAVKNEKSTYLYDRFFHHDRATNTYYQLNMSHKVDKSEINKINDNEFDIKLKLDDYEIEGNMCFESLKNDTVISGNAFIRDIDAIASKSKEYKYQIQIPHKGSTSFKVKIIPQIGDKDTIEYKLQRNIDGKLSLVTDEGNIVLNSVAAAKYEQLQEKAELVSKINEAEAVQKDYQQMLRLFLIAYFGLCAVGDFLQSRANRKNNVQ